MRWKCRKKIIVIKFNKQKHDLNKIMANINQLIYDKKVNKAYFSVYEN